MNLQGKTALITGASRGIGKAIALQLAQQGMEKLLLVARDEERLKIVALEVEKFGVEAVILPLDLTQPVEVNVAVARAWKNHGPIHLLVNCAGMGYQTPFLQSRLSQVQEEIALNLVGLYTMTRLIGRRMAVHRQGWIVNVSSLMGKVAAPTMATYSATKFAIVGFSQALRSELAPYNVKVSVLLPSLTETDMVKGIKKFRWVLSMTPEQVARTLVWGLRWNQPEILVGWQTKLAILGSYFAPGLVEKLVQLASPSVEILPQFNQK